MILLTILKYMIGFCSSVMSLFCAFVIIDVAYDMIMQAVFHRPGSITKYDRIDYINIFSISAVLMLCGCWVARKCFFDL